MLIGREKERKLLEDIMRDAFRCVSIRGNAERSVLTEKLFKK